MNVGPRLFSHRSWGVPGGLKAASRDRRVQQAGVVSGRVTVVVRDDGLPRYELDDGCCPKILVPAPTTWADWQQFIEATALLPRHALLEPLHVRDDLKDLAEPSASDLARGHEYSQL